MLNSRMRDFRRLFNVSTLTFRLWNFTGTALLNLLLWATVLAYLSPLSYMVATALKTNAQLSDSAAPILPAQARSFTYQGTEYPVYEVPTADGVKEWALVNPFRKYSEFVDPANPDAGLIHWDGSWRSLSKAYTPSVTFNNFVTLWNSIDYPLRLRNSLIVVGLAELGVMGITIE